jgi:transposase
MASETLRRWVRQAQIDAGQATGVTWESAELEQTIEILKAPTCFFGGRATRDRGDLPVHRRA